MKINLKIINKQNLARGKLKKKKKRNKKALKNLKLKHYTYWLGTNGVLLTSGWTTCPIAKIPPPFTPSKQWANIFLTPPDEASCEIIDELDFPNPIIPSSASSLVESRFPDCLAPQLQKRIINQ